MAGFLLTLLALTSILMIFIVLLQRGRGGGLAGAFGGLGGQSAFGTKAGDVFTKITVAVAILWVVLAAGCGFAVRADVEQLSYEGGDDVQIVPGDGAAAGGATSEGGENGLNLPPVEQPADQPPVEDKPQN